MAERLPTKPGQRLVPAHRRGLPTASSIGPHTGRRILPTEIPPSTAPPIDPLSAAFGYPVPTLPAEGITTAPSFQTWSEKIAPRLRDEEGNIKKTYHGTIYDFEKLALGEPVSDVDVITTDEDNQAADPLGFIGSHFTESADVGTKFAQGLYKVWRTGEEELSDEPPMVPGGRVIPAYLQITNPFVVTEEKMHDIIFKEKYDHELVTQQLKKHIGEYVKPNQRTADAVDVIVSFYENNENFRREVNLDAVESAPGGWPTPQGIKEPDISLAHEMGTRFRENLIEEGYDGIIYPNTGEGGGDSYIVFKHDQIRSAISPEEEYKHGGFVDKPLYDRAI